MPQLTVVAGPNGSGKSTLIRYLLSQNIFLGHYINADDIAQKQRLSGEIGSRQAQRIADNLRKTYLEAKSDFSFETVMSHASKPEFMETARSNGYHVTLYFVCTDAPVINVSRVNYRVKHGGHDVPVDRIITRYYRTLELLPRAIAASDVTVLFDNTEDRTLNIKKALRPVARVVRNSFGLLQKDFEEWPPKWANDVLKIIDLNSH